MILETTEQRRALLERSRTIAVVGASVHPERASHGVFRFLRDQEAYDVTPVSPALPDGLDGVAAFPTLAAYAAERGAPDIVDVFRRPEETPQIAREAVAAGAKAIWFQLGIVNEEAIRIADAAGLDVVVDHCIKIELARRPSSQS